MSLNEVTVIGAALEKRAQFYSLQSELKQFKYLEICLNVIDLMRVIMFT